MMTSAKKEIFLQLQQMHKQEHSTFEFEIELFIRYYSFTCRNLLAKGRSDIIT